MRYLFVILCAVFIFSACGKSEKPTPLADLKRYRLHGKVISVDKTKKSATIAHDPVEGYMEAMTMDFPIKDEDVLNTLAQDAEIDADLVVDNPGGKYWLENFAVVSAPDPNKPAPTPNQNFAQIGNQVPDFKLTNQDGKAISFNDYRGRALAITFIYTRCPLPDYCIKMSKNFSDAANFIHTQPEFKDKIRLLSISFDPETDTPQVLKSYGLGYLGKDSQAADFKIWQLATAPDQEVRKIADFFGLHYEVDSNNKTLIDHSLTTIVIAPDGTVKKIIPGNEWTTQELLNEMQSTLK